MGMAAGVAHAEVVQGRLELHWGDPPRDAPEAQKDGVFNVTLVTDAGERVALPADQARRAAGDLYALANRRVAVEFSAAKSSARTVEVIVPADRLSIDDPVLSNTGKVMAAAPITGTTRWVTLMCKFSDIPAEQKARDFFQSQYGSAPGELGHYWKEVSYGKIDLAGSDAYGWFTLPQPRSFYVTKVDGKDKADLSQLFKDCAAAADAEVSFAGVQGINQMFNGDLDGFAWGGGSCAPLDGVNTCKSVTWNPPWAFSNLAPLAHEMGHGYGLPHSDNSDGDSDTYDNPWDVMSDAWSDALRSAVFGTLPKHINIYQRERLGWVDAARKQTIGADSQRVTINLDFASLATSSNRQMVVLTLPIQGGAFQNVIYTLEARRKTGAYESNLAGDAVIIHSLQNTGVAKSMDADVPPANRSNNEGSMFKVGETWVSPDPLETFWVTVEAVTATGFRISAGPKPRYTGGNQQPRLAPSAVGAASPATPVAPNPASAAPPATPSIRSGGPRRMERSPLRSQQR